jgi:hypothetical protein
MQTVMASIDILPRRTTLRTALRRGRRKTDNQPAFGGGFDPIEAAREFARREGFGEPPRPTEPVYIADLVQTDLSAHSFERTERTEPVQPVEPARPAEALAAEALTELSRLSAYNPTSMPAIARTGLARRPLRYTRAGESEPDTDGPGPRTRTAANVRSMLAGFRAGVERGRSSAPARPVQPTDDRDE